MLRDVPAMNPQPSRCDAFTPHSYRLIPCSHAAKLCVSLQ
jgi:hypothetical protein